MNVKTRLFLTSSWMRSNTRFVRRHSFRTRTLGIWAAVLLTPAGCAQENPSQEPTPAGTGGSIGIPRSLKTQPPIELPFHTPSGRELQPGARDALGYRLPLDVVYARAQGSTSNTDPEPTHELDSRTGNSLDSPPNARRGGAIPESRVSQDDGHSQNESSIGARDQTLVAGWNSYTDDGLFMGVARSGDGGESWTTSLITGHSVMSDPAIRTANGNWYFAYLAAGGPGGSDIDIYVRRSTDDGVTWQNPIDASQNSSFDDKPFIDAKGGEVLVAWADFGHSPARITASRSLDGGLTFGSRRLLGSNSTGNGASPVIDRDGNYFVFWRGSSQESLWVASSFDQGDSWTPDRGIVDMNPLPSSLPGGFRIVNLPSADSDPVTGDLVVVWNDQRFGNPDVLAIRSTDDGLSWSEPVRVNDDPGTGAQWFPWIFFDENGIAHVVWYDRRNDTNLIDVYYSQSLDGGLTWQTNIRVTEAGFPPTLPWDTTIDFIGDYIGVAAANGVAFPCFQDSREGTQDIYVSVLDPDPSTVPEIGDEDPDTSRGPRLAATPNPFRNSVQIRLTPQNTFDSTGQSDSETTARSLRIFGVDGRLIRRVPASAGGRFDWNGLDEKGLDVAPGSYYARLGDQQGPGLRIVKLN